MIKILTAELRVGLDKQLLASQSGSKAERKVSKMDDPSDPGILLVCRKWGEGLGHVEGRKHLGC